MAAKLLREDIVKKLDDLSDFSWPPALEAVSDDSRKPTDSVYMFLQKLLNPRNKASANVSRVIESLSQYIAFAVMKGKVLQRKQFLLALGLHSLTGGRKVIDIIHKLGHCMSYNLTSEIETAQAESSLLAATQTTLVSLVPATPGNTVFTHFWADNFDKNIERMVGGGSINTTHLIAYQELSHGATTNTEGIIIPKKKVANFFMRTLLSKLNQLIKRENQQLNEPSNTK